jgi:predicted amidohydrolase
MISSRAFLFGVRITPLVIVIVLCFPIMSEQRNNIGTISFNLAGLKLIPTPWDKQANFEKLERWTRKAASDGADFVVTPEGYLDGYTVNAKLRKDSTMEKVRAIAEPVDGPLLLRVAALADELNIHLLVGFAEQRDDDLYNSAVIFSPQGEKIALYSKAHNARDEPFTRDGEQFPVFDSVLGRLGMLICYDRQLPETARILAVKGAQIILVPAFGLGTTEINEDIMMRTRAYENGVYVAHVHPINTFIVDPQGKIIAQEKGVAEKVVMAEIVFDERVGNGPIRDRRPEIYEELITVR